MAVERTEDLAAGVVKVTPHSLRGQPWYLIEIGRGRYIKRLNLNLDEAAQLTAQLVTLATPR